MGNCADMYLETKGVLRSPKIIRLSSCGIGKSVQYRSVQYSWHSLFSEDLLIPNAYFGFLPGSEFP